MKKLLALACMIIFALSTMACVPSLESSDQSSVSSTSEGAQSVSNEVESMPETTANEESETMPITIGMTWAIKSVEPTNGGNPWALTSCGISESVYRQDKTGALVSRFVRGLKQIDALNWEITLKEDVKFSDGSVVDAEAFAKSMNTVMEENPLANATAGKITFSPKSDFVVTARTERETKVLNSVLCEWTNIVFKELGNGDYIFTGPYLIQNLESGISMSLIPNAHYPEANKRGNLLLKAFKDVSAMKLAIESGEIDMAFTVTPEVAQMLGDAGINVKTIEAGYQYFSPINLKGVLSDSKLRQAINLALNRQEYLVALNGGHLPTGTFASYNSFAGNVAIEFNQVRANALLDEAGYALVDGKRQKDGEPLSLTLVTYPSRPDLSIIMQVMATQLNAVGVSTETKIVESIDEELRAGNYDIALYAQHTSPTGNPAFFLNQFFRTGGPKNVMGYSSSEFDNLLNQMAELPLGAEMDQLAIAAQNVLYKDLPILLLVDPQWHVALSERLKDYTPYCGDYYIINNQLFEE